MEVAHRSSRGFAGAGRDAGGRGGHGFGAGQDLVHRPVVQPAGDAVHLGQLREARLSAQLAGAAANNNNDIIGVNNIIVPVGYSIRRLTVTVMAIQQCREIAIEIQDYCK